MKSKGRLNSTLVLLLQDFQHVPSHGTNMLHATNLAHCANTAAHSEMRTLAATPTTKQEAVKTMQQCWQDCFQVGGQCMWQDWVCLQRRGRHSASNAVCH